MTITKTDPKKDAEAIKKIVVARVKMLMRNPFFGTIVTRLVLKNADDWCDTAATDGIYIYYNSEFICKLRDKEVEFLVAHELFHILYMHMDRRGDRDPRMSNIAADYAVNDSCIEYKLGELITTIPCLYDPKYHGWSYEQIYDDLIQNSTKINLDDLVDKLLDDHIEGSDGGDGDGVGKKPSLSKDEIRQIKNNIKEAMLDAAQAVGASNVPCGMKRLLEGLTESKMDWREIIRQNIESQLKSDFTYMRPSRKGWGCDAILPSMAKLPAVECTVALDMSGSIGSKEIKDFFGEIVGMMEQFRSFNIGIMTWDTAVHGYKEFTEDNIDELMEYEPHGGGGTDSMCIYNFLKAEDIVPKQLIIFTDMKIFGEWGDPDYTNTIWVAHKSDSVAPFGITVKYS